MKIWLLLTAARLSILILITFNTKFVEPCFCASYGVSYMGSSFLHLHRDIVVVLRDLIRYLGMWYRWKYLLVGEARPTVCPGLPRPGYSAAMKVEKLR